MSITVLSPHSGNPTKLRDKDVGRAVQDAEGRTFYLLQEDNGEYYSALTRAGGEKEIARYHHMLERSGFKNEAVLEDKPVDNYRRPAQRKSAGFPVGKLLKWLIVLGALAGGAYYAGTHGYLKIPGITK